MRIHYQITLAPTRHIYQVELTFIAVTDTQELALPVWIPGSYMLREFSKNILELRASQAASQPQLTQNTKHTWQLSNLDLGSKVWINYGVYAYDSGIRSAFLDHLRGYFNPTSLCLAVRGSEAMPHQLSFKLLPPGWQVACGLGVEHGVYLAQNYMELLDSPFELGAFERLEFSLAGIQHYLVLSGSIPAFDRDRILNDLTKICAYQLKLFGGIAPYSDYTFILHLSGDIYTGLEHSNSTLLMAPYFALPNLRASNNDDYFKLLGLISHEFFHTWNVKRIKPKAFMPYNLDQENYTKLLWWFEGVTSYYDDLVLYRTGIIDQAKYLSLILDTLNKVYKFAGVKQQSVANSSLSAWIKYYRQDENSPNCIVSYYLKGALIALCLDLQIRDQSAYSLDEVMLYLSQQSEVQACGIGEEEIPELIKAATGVELSDFIQLATESCAMLPYVQLLAKFGVDLVMRVAQNHQDSGGITSAQSKSLEQLPLDLGAKLVKAPLGYSIQNVYADTPAEVAGLAAGDKLIALNNLELINVEKQLGLLTEGETAKLSLLRNGQLLELSIQLYPSVASLFDLTIVDSELLSHWL